MLQRVESASPDNHQRLVCTRCRRHASFITPVGLLCRTDALIAAIHHGWLPVQVKESDLAAWETWGLDPDRWHG